MYLAHSLRDNSNQDSSLVFYLNSTPGLALQHPIRNYFHLFYRFQSV